MKGLNKTASFEWYQFPHADEEMEMDVRINVTFMLSNWECIFGRGCPGCFGKTSENIFQDIGCCTIGAHVLSRAERDRLQVQVDSLTTDDISQKGLDYIRRKGWYRVEYDNVREDPDDISIKTRVRDGGCVFANRADEGDGKIGCAFVHQGKRMGIEDHVEFMPDTCWAMPIGMEYSEDPVTGKEMLTLTANDADSWQGEDDDGTHDSWLSWWCVDTPDAYRAEKPLYRTMDKELTKILGEETYRRLCEYLDVRWQKMDADTPRMPGSLLNDGRPLLPLYVGNRTPKRLPKS